MSRAPSNVQKSLRKVQNKRQAAQKKNKLILKNLPEKLIWILEKIKRTVMNGIYSMRELKLKVEF